MAGKVIFYILGALLIIPGIGGLVTGLATPSGYGNVGAGRAGFGTIFLVIGAILVWAGAKIKTNNS